MKPTKWPLPPAKTHISLGRSVSIVHLWVQTFFRRTAKTDQTEQMPRLIRVFTDHTGYFVDFVMLPFMWYLPHLKVESFQPFKQTKWNTNCKSEFWNPYLYEVFLYILYIFPDHSLPFFSTCQVKSSDVISCPWYHFFSCCYIPELLQKDKMLVMHLSIWAATLQNQQSDCEPSEDTDQPGHPSSLIRVFTVLLMGS